MRTSFTCACVALFAVVSIGCGPRPIVEERTVIEDRTVDAPIVDPPVVGQPEVDVNVGGNGVTVDRTPNPDGTGGVEVQVGGGQGVQVEVGEDNQ